MNGSPAARRVPLAIAFGLVSASVVSLQIGVIRVLSVASYHHFSYLVISIALLGFGASGTLLSILRHRVRRRFAPLSALALVAFAVSASWGYRLAASIPLDIQYVLYSLSETAWLIVYILVLFVPFFSGGFFVGAVIEVFADRIGGLYAVNMTASGLGGLLAVALATLMPAERIPGWFGLIGAGAAVLWVAGLEWSGSERIRPVRVGVALAVVAALASIAFPPELRIDRYKAEAHAIRLVDQGDAELIAERHGPRARLTVYDAPSMHYTLFASPLAPLPPGQLHVFVDAASAGAVFVANSPDEAPIVHSLPQSLAYRLAERPNVLILGETTGVNVWLALAYGARSVTVVQENPALADLVGSDLSGSGSSVFSRSGVRVVTSSPRLYLERNAEHYDIIHFAEAEGMPASTGGLTSLREDYLLTVEAVAGAMQRLTPSGLITVTRGLQSPPRDNIRLFALFAAAAAQGGGDVGDRLLQARNYLAATTIVAAGNIGRDRISRFMAASVELTMDVDYFPGIRESDLTRRNVVDSGAGNELSPYYLAATAIANGTTTEHLSFRDFDMTPPTDNRPFFHNFSSISSIVSQFGQLPRGWFARLELGTIVVALTLVVVILLGLVLVTVPAVIAGVRSRRRESGARGTAGWCIAHFALIGTGFMLLEILFIQQFTRFLGDPLLSATATLTSILLFAGAGSAVQSRLPLRPAFRVSVGATSVVALTAVHAVISWPLLDGLQSGSTVVRFLVAVAALLPVSFALGWQFPAGISMLGNRVVLLTSAWAANGVASVVAAPLAVMLAMRLGFHSVLVLAMVCYAAVAALAALRGRTPVVSPTVE